eukprot:TRINITY_DN1568_c0_g2_i1.p1 TRINITY_DN1568_c0_g2~~TRINITY_DN1568_c0_g2_i1.p1  ORF type:complete len:129 (+),score=42.96 TRINITY_DN1568_c0_g2_i1:99-485(+)
MGFGGKGKGGNPLMQMMMMMMKGKGKGKTGLKSFKGELRVWIGGLPTKDPPAWDAELNKRLKEHMSSTGLTCQYAQVGKGGSGGAAFKTKEEADQAVAVLNGSVFEGSVIQVDRLTKNGVYWTPGQAA